MNIDGTPIRPGVDDATIRAPLAQLIAAAIGAEEVQLDRVDRLTGGAIQENWAVDLQVRGGPEAGSQQWVLRTDAPAVVATSLTRLQEFAVLRTAHGAGVRAPRPVCAVAESDVLGRPFFLMQRLPGLAAGHRLTRDAALVPEPRALVRDLGTALARLHAVSPPQRDLSFLDAPEGSPALHAIGEYRAYLDTLEEPQPALEWGLRWCERNVPDNQGLSLIHRDFRTGNYLVAEGRLSGVLDWEFAAFGDPREDIGWFSARCWRFGAARREAGGVGEMSDFLDAYSAESGRSISCAELTYWQVMAHLRWSIIALQQAQRHLSGKEVSLELALTGRLVPELELEVFNLIEGAS